jgi:hypothetical protein
MVEGVRWSVRSHESADFYTEGEEFTHEVMNRRLGEQERQLHELETQLFRNQGRSRRRDD